MALHASLVALLQEHGFPDCGRPLWLATDGGAAEAGGPAATASWGLSCAYGQLWRAAGSPIRSLDRPAPAAELCALRQAGAFLRAL
eukprot:8753279-Alexandrium_andersonii.AAC.1